MKSSIDMLERSGLWLLLSLSVIFLYPTLTFLGKIIIIVAVIFFWLTRATSRIHLGFGFLIPLLAAAGSGAVLILSIFYIAFTQRLKPLRIGWLYPFILILLYWSATSFIGGEYAAWRELLKAESPMGALNAMLQYSQLPFVTKVSGIARYLIIALLFSALCGSNNRVFVLRGLFSGALIAALLSGFQLLGDPLGIAPEASPYWLGLERYSGTFTDPNAFGLATLLILMLYLGYSSESTVQKQNQIILAGILALGVLALYSGSRSYLLGLALLGFVLVWSKNAKVAVGLILLALSSVIGLKILTQLEPALIANFRELLPASMGRMLDLVSGLGEGAFSRRVFWTVGSAIWLDHPFFGVGFGNFREYFPGYATSLGFDVGAWVDNSNNFYLGILAELGILGGLALLCAGIAVRFKSISSKIDRSSIVIFLILLFFGPHLDFDEVAVLFALLLATVAELKADRPGLSIISGSLFVLLLIFGVRPASAGLYLWERQSDGSYLRWTMPKALVTLRCTHELSKSAVLKFRSLHPDISSNPLRVVFSVPGAQHVREPRSPTQFEVRFQCIDDSIPVEIEVSRGWIPREFGMGNDSRVLGVQLIYDTSQN